MHDCTSYGARGFFRWMEYMHWVVSYVAAAAAVKRISFIFFIFFLFFFRFFFVFISLCEALKFTKTTTNLRLNEWRCGPPCLLLWCTRLTFFTDKLPENHHLFVFCHSFCSAGRRIWCNRKQRRKKKKAASDVADSIVDWHSEKAK